MLNKMRNRQGFTLIELLIVVAIIGILAAIAIPQFSAYRQRGYNSTSLSDMKNTKTAEESLYADAQCYGAVDAAAALLTAPVAATDLILTGPMAAAVGGSTPVAGGRISGTNSGGAVGSLPLGLSNGVYLQTRISTDLNSTPVANATNSYLIATRHKLADSAYGSDSDNTTVTYRVSNSQWAGNVGMITAPAITSVALPAPTVGVDNFNPAGVAAAGGGAPTATWTLM
jgi:prepilin-type N-terminal cleavage/methylation domain-containing protein